VSDYHTYKTMCPVVAKDIRVFQAVASWELGLPFDGAVLSL
jgi:hypothetical protein